MIRATTFSPTAFPHAFNFDQAVWRVSSTKKGITRLDLEGWVPAVCVGESKGQATIFTGESTVPWGFSGPELDVLADVLGVNSGFHIVPPRALAPDEVPSEVLAACLQGLEVKSRMEVRSGEILRVRPEELELLASQDALMRELASSMAVTPHPEPPTGFTGWFLPNAP